MRPILLGSSLLLVAVGLVNLLATLLLVTKERARDFAIFKAVGLTPRGVLGVVNAGGAALGAIAIVVGIPLGLVIFRAVMTRDEPERGHGHHRRARPVRPRAVVPFVLAVTVLASAVPGATRRRARHAGGVAAGRVSSALAHPREHEPEQHAGDAADDPGDPRASVVASGSSTRTAAIASTPSRSLSSSRPGRRPSTSRIVQAASMPSAAPFAPRTMLSSTTSAATYAPPTPQTK